MHLKVSVNVNSPLRLLFVGKASNGGFAIDQITFTKGDCKSESIIATENPSVMLGFSVAGWNLFKLASEKLDKPFLQHVRFLRYNIHTYNL